MLRCYLPNLTFTYSPNLMVTDIAAVVALAKKHSLLVVVDNTFLSPYLQNPLALGADVVVHSVTKYIAGHSDVLMGAVLTNNDQVCARLRSAQNFMGAVPSPFEYSSPLLLVTRVGRLANALAAATWR